MKQMLFGCQKAIQNNNINVKISDKNKIIFYKQLNFITMNAMKNRVQLIGNVGNDPEIKVFEGDRKLASITIATNDGYKNDKGEWVEQTEWHRVSAWGKTAEIIEKYVTKGKQVAIEGKLTNRSYDDKNGEKRYITEVVVSEILFFSKN
jgi:single-strand DNA-binding protein